MERLKEFADKVLEWARPLSDFLRHYLEVIRPFYEAAVISIAAASLLLAVIQFFSRRKLTRQIDDIQEKLSGEWQELWLLRNPQPYEEPRGIAARVVSIFRRSPSPVRTPKRICIFNQKGGVGKTTLAMNLAAYFDQKLGKKTLLVDLDYQGSLSSAMLSACDIFEVTSNVNELFEDHDLNGSKVLRLSIQLDKKLPNTRIITSFLPFGKLENKLMMRWLVQDNYPSDLRHVLARALLFPEVMEEFDAVIFDCPPRLTTGTVNALCASTHILVPTVLDKMSARAVGPTLENVKRLSATLNPNLQLLGVVGNLTRNKLLDPREQEGRDMVLTYLRSHWEDGRIFERTLPRRKEVSDTAGEDIAYLRNVSDFQELFDELGAQIADDLWGRELSRLEAAE